MWLNLATQGPGFGISEKKQDIYSTRSGVLIIPMGERDLGLTAFLAQKGYIGF